MKAVTEEAIGRIEHAVMAYATLAYAALSVVGSIFKIAALEFVTTDPRVVVPTIAAFMYFLSRHAVRVTDDLSKLKISSTGLAFQADANSCHASMWSRAESARSRRAWASYLNPDAFKSGDIQDNLKEYYKKAEKFDPDDYRRVFGIYPDLPQYRETRSKTIEWLKGHIKRTVKLRAYQVRYVELEFQAAEMWIDDGGINFSFPSALVMEAGWSTSDPRAIDLAKDYYQQLWQHSRPIAELFAKASSGNGT